MAIAPERIREQLDGQSIWIVPYCHPDWAWTHTRHWHELRYVLVIEEALDIIAEQERQGIEPDAPDAFRWYADCWITQIDLFLKQRPQRADELRRRIAQGRIALCGGFANVRINHVPGELFVRSLQLGRQRFEDHFPGADLRVHADAVDVAVAHPQVPQLLRLEGYRFFQFWRPEDALNAKGIPHQFVWEGLDGSRVIAARGCYGYLVQPQGVPENPDENWDETLGLWWEHTLKVKRPHSVAGMLWIQEGADDNRPLRTHFNQDQPLDLPAFIRAWNARENAPMRFATPVEAFDELNRRQDRLPLVSGTLDPCDVCYNAAWGGSNGLWRKRELCTKSLLQAEWLTAAAATGGLLPQADADSAAQTIERRWEDTLTIATHASQWLFQDDFDHFEEVAYAVLGEARRLREHALDALAAGIDTGHRAIALAVNTLPYARTEIMPLRITFVEGDKGGVPDALRLIDARGQHIPYQVLGEMHHAGVRWELDALVQIALPAGGWNTVRWENTPPVPETAAQTGDSTSFENNALSVGFRRGRLVTIRDPNSSRDWHAPVDTPFGHIRLHDVDPEARLHVGDTLGQQDVCWDSWAVTERGPLRWTLENRGYAGPHPVAMWTRLYRDEARVEFTVDIDWRGYDGFITAMMPCPGAGTLHGDMPFCVETKDLEAEPYIGIERQRQGMFIAQSFVDWCDGNTGIAYVSHDGDRYHIWDSRTNTLEHILINSVRRPQNTWEQHVNERMEAVGHSRFTFSIVPHAGTWRDAELVRTAETLRTPALRAWPGGGPATVPACQSMLSVDAENVAVSAFLREKGGAVHLRMVETHGHAATCTVHLPFNVESAHIAGKNAEHRNTSEPIIHGSSVRLELAPWEIVTLRLTAGGRLARL